MGAPMNRKALRKAIANHFKLDQIQTLCFDLGIDFEELEGKAKTGKVREIIKEMENAGRLHELIDYLKSERPNVNWADLFSSPVSASLKLPSARVAVWNALNKTLWSKRTFLNEYKGRTPLIDKFSVELWAEIIKKPIDLRPHNPKLVLKEIYDYFFSCNDDEWRNCLEFILNYWNYLHYYQPDPINEAVNKALKKEKTGLIYKVTYEFNHYLHGELLEESDSDPENKA